MSETSRHISLRGLSRDEARERLTEVLTEVWTSSTATAMAKAAHRGADDDTLAGMAEVSLEDRDASIAETVDNLLRQLAGR